MVQVIDVKLEYITPILGINPIDDVGTLYIKEKGKKEIEKLKKQINKTKNEEEKKILQQKLERLEAEFENNENFSIKDDQRLKIFARNKEGALCWLHFQIKGHLKEVAQNFEGTSWLRNSISKYVDIFPYEADYTQFNPDYDYIPILRPNGEKIYQPDEILSRPLTSWINGQYIVTINSSEKINPPAELWFRIVIWDTGKTDKKPTPDIIKKLLEYGTSWGHSGWRTARYGRYNLIEFKVNGIVRKTIKITKK